MMCFLYPTFPPVLQSRRYAGPYIYRSRSSYPPMLSFPEGNQTTALNRLKLIIYFVHRRGAQVYLIHSPYTSKIPFQGSIIQKKMLKERHHHFHSVLTRYVFFYFVAKVPHDKSTLQMCLVRVIIPTVLRWLKKGSF